MVLQQALIWSQPTRAWPACLNLMVITTMLAHTGDTPDRWNQCEYTSYWAGCLRTRADQPDGCVRAKLKEYKGGSSQSNSSDSGGASQIGARSSAPVSAEGCQEPQVSLGTQEMEPTCNLHIWDSLPNKAFLMHLPFGDLQCQTMLIKAKT